MTYDEILSKMRLRYRELSGFNADDASDIGIRLKVLAAEMAEYYARLEELERQVFPQTSTGKYLELHAETKAVSRKPGLKSSGVLRFSRETPAYSDIVIPAGIICATRPQSFEEQLCFVTAADVTLPAGEFYADAPAEAQSPGAAGNIAARACCVMVTPAAGISSVENTQPFGGGADEESDEALRERLLLAYRNISNGTNSAFYYDLAMGHEGVSSVNVLPRRRGRGTVDVVIACRSGEEDAAEGIAAAIQEDMNLRKEINVDVAVLAAARHDAAVTAEIEAQSGRDFNVVKEKVRREIEGYLNGLGVGRPLLLGALGNRILGVEGVYNFRIASPPADMYPLSDAVLRAGEVTVTGTAVR